ncbi:sigma 54-interacting transcriptional regulator [Candidatus Woesearchaeota archaeon]|nr:sigma 54-interacting transcriptional regulator [Candidatus Woesearchaeota archaeon]
MAGRTDLKYEYPEIIGKSEGLIQVLKQVDQTVDSDTPVLLVGESGVGKELIAKVIHDKGKRREHYFVSDHCAAISSILLEKELFGDAERPNRKSKIQLADKGTLLLDGIESLAFDSQVRLLEAMQEGFYINTAGERIEFDVRLITSTNDKNLAKRVDEGHKLYGVFYDYISQQTIRIPPLRERKEDISLLINHFLAGQKKGMGAEARKLLQEDDWPGNVRQLENEIKRMCILAGESISKMDLPHRLLFRNIEDSAFEDLIYETRVLEQFPEESEYCLKSPIAILVYKDRPVVHDSDNKGEYTVVHLNDGDSYPSTMYPPAESLDEAIKNFCEGLVYDLKMLEEDGSEHLGSALVKKYQYLQAILEKKE